MSGRRGSDGGALPGPGTACRTSGSAATSDGNIRTGTNVAGGGATNRPSRTCRRHVNNSPGYTPCRAATSVTRAPASSVSATICNFSSIDQRRRRSRPVMISIVPPITDLKLRLMHSFKVRSLRHPTGEPEGVADRTLTDGSAADLLRSENAGGDWNALPTHTADGAPPACAASENPNHTAHRPEPTHREHRHPGQRQSAHRQSAAWWRTSRSRGSGPGCVGHHPRPRPQVNTADDRSVPGPDGSHTPGTARPGSSPLAQQCQNCRATPTECLPFLRQPVSSTTSTPLR